jgi:hypothetical protein
MRNRLCSSISADEASRRDEATVRERADRLLACSVKTSHIYRGISKEMGRCDVVMVNGLHLAFVPGFSLARSRSGMFVTWLPVDSVSADMSSPPARPQQASAAASRPWPGTCGPDRIRSYRSTTRGLHGSCYVVGPNLSLGTNSAIPPMLRDPRSDLPAGFDTIRTPESFVRLGH